MTRKEFRDLIVRLESLDETQLKKCREKLEESLNRRNQGGRKTPEVIAESTPERCPHCSHEKLSKWGTSNGLQRWRCKECARTFNILTGTPLARLRKRAKWKENARAMISGASVRDTAAQCGVHRNTSFRWRHRFLLIQQKAQCQDLSGIAESDATYFRLSEKGARKLKRKPRKRGGDGIGPGVNKNLVAVLTLRDRTGKGAERIALQGLRQPAEELFKTHLRADTLLLTDGSHELRAAGRARNPNAYIDLPGSKSRGSKNSPYHLQTNNAFHSQLKTWMARFCGVATKYLANYLGWYRHLAEQTHCKDPDRFILLAFRPLSVHPQLTVT